LVALIIFVGFFVAIMFLMWLTSVLSFSQVSVPVTIVDEPLGRGDAAKGYDRDWEEPGAEEVEDLMEPQVEALLEAVTDLATTQAAALDALRTDATATARGRGLGDSRAAGPGGAGGAVPRWVRWEIRFSAKGLDAYARQLDHFNIELGAAGGGSAQIDYVSGFTELKPRRRSGKGGQESRLYMTWTSGALQEFDRKLLARAGVRTQGRVLLQFYPREAENTLAALEMQKAGGRTVDEIRKTVFGVRRSGSGYEFHVRSGSGYEFHVSEQRYRVVPTSASS
jgi:hypothetical protein